MTRIASPTELDDVAALLDSCKEEDLAAILEAVDAPQSFLDPPGHISQEDGTRDAEEFCAPPATRVPAGEKPPKCASPALTAGELKRMLAEHKSSVIHEVRQLVTTENPAEDEEEIGAASWEHQAMLESLHERDDQVSQLEARLAELRSAVATRDSHIMKLGVDLDATIREIRHGQLDLEFQRLKLEEQYRENHELEQSTLRLQASIEEKTFDATHAAIDFGRTFQGGPMGDPERLRMTGSLPWTLRRGRLQAIN